MTRSKHFHPDREPLRKHASLELVESRTTGPFSFLNPTQAHYRHRHASGTPKTVNGEAQDDSDESEKQYSGDDGQKADAATPQSASNFTFKWTSRNNRKGRHALRIKPATDDPSTVNYKTPRPSTDYREVLRTIGKMLFYYPVWDVSWWVAYIFTWGSVVWVINAFFVFLPVVRPSTEFKDEILTGGGVTAFIGATIFEIGSVLLMFEAINENRSGCFGWAVEQVYDAHAHLSHRGGGADAEKGGVMSIKPDMDGCSHHHVNRKNFVGKPHRYESNTGSAPVPGAGPSNGDADASKMDGEAKSWQWWPSAYDLRTHYLHDIGFLACSSQMFGATIFWISGFTALPGINNNMSQGLLDGIYWVPQVVGGSGFIVSGFLFMIETQKVCPRRCSSVLLREAKSYAFHSAAADVSHRIGIHRR